MDLGVVRPRVVLWVIFERPGASSLIVSRDGGRGRTARIVRPNRVCCRRRLQDRRNAPDRSVARSEVEAGRQGGVDGHEVIVPEPVSVAFSGKSLLSVLMVSTSVLGE